MQQPEKIEYAAKIANHRRNRRPHRAHADDGNEDWVQNDIDDGTKHGAHHRFCGHSLTANEIGVDKTEYDNGCTEFLISENGCSYFRYSVV